MRELIRESTNASKIRGDRVAIVGAGGFGVSTSLIAALGMLGVAIVNLDDDMSDRRRNLFGRFDVDQLDDLTRLRSPTWSGMELAPRPEITFVDSPKPLSRRRLRRLRGKAGR